MEGERLLFLHNFSTKKIKLAKKEFSDPDTQWVPLFYGAKTRHSRDGGILLEGHDYEWLRADFQD